MARRKLSSEINVVPYIDVMLVLLIIFMITAPLMTQGIEVDLPDVNAQSMTAGEDERILQISAQGQYFLSFVGEGKQALDDEKVKEAVGAVVRNAPEAMILVMGDAKVPYERVAHAMSLLSDAGAKKIGFVTQPADDKK